MIQRAHIPPPIPFPLTLLGIPDSSPVMHTHEGCIFLLCIYLMACLLQGKWSTEEDEQLLRLVGERGRKWKEIGGAIGRMPEACRDRWLVIRWETLLEGTFACVPTVFASTYAVVHCDGGRCPP